MACERPASPTERESSAPLPPHLLQRPPSFALLALALLHFFRSLPNQSAPGLHLIRRCANAGSSRQCQRSAITTRRSGRSQRRSAFLLMSTADGLRCGVQAADRLRVPRATGKDAALQAEITLQARQSLWASHTLQSMIAASAQESNMETMMVWNNLSSVSHKQLAGRGLHADGVGGLILMSCF